MAEQLLPQHQPDHYLRDVDSPLRTLTFSLQFLEEGCRNQRPIAFA